MPTTSVLHHRVIALLALTFGACAMDVVADDGAGEDVAAVASALTAKTATEVRLGINADHRILAFYIAPTSAIIYHTWQTTAGGPWNGSGVRLLSRGGLARHLEVIPDADRLLHVFFIGTNGGLYMTQQLSSGGWQAEQSLGGSAEQIAVAANEDGRLELFYIGTDHALYHNYQMADGSWSGEFRLGGDNDRANALTVGKNPSGRLELFFTDVQNVLRHMWQVAPNEDWSAPALLETGANEALQMIAMNNWAGAPAVFYAPIDLLYIGTNNTLYHNPGFDSEDGWNGERLLRSSSMRARSFTAVAHPLAIGPGLATRLEVFYCSSASDRLVYETEQHNDPLDSWEPAQTLSSTPNACRQIVAAVNGSLFPLYPVEVVYIGTDGKLYRNRGTHGSWDGQTLL